MYPAIVCVFWTKLRATQAFIDKTPLRVFLYTRYTPIACLLWMDYIY
jgi:hypothetical protein